MCCSGLKRVKAGCLSAVSCATARNGRGAFPAALGTACLPASSTAKPRAVLLRVAAVAVALQAVAHQTQELARAQKIRAAGNKSSGSFLLVHAAASKPKTDFSPAETGGLKTTWPSWSCALPFWLSSSRPWPFSFGPSSWRSSLPTSSWRLVSSWPQLLLHKKVRATIAAYTPFTRPHITQGN